jgi:hypothetical protein
MAGKTILVRGVLGCAGEWGFINPGDEKELPRDIAESLMRAGHVEPVNPTSEDEKKESHASPSAPVKRKSKRAKGS